MERIDRKTMAGLMQAYGTEDTPRVYTHRNRLVSELFWRSHERTLALSKSSKGGRALDFGGGNGVLLRELSHRFDEVVCIDLNADIAREVARIYGLPNVQVLSEDIFKLGLPDGHFNVVIAAQVLEHILDLGPLSGEISRLLAPGGELLVSAPSENRIYKIGRRLAGYTKPWDHHHDGRFIINTVGARLKLSGKRYFPINWSPLAVFYLLRFVKPEATRA